jgi:biopolymer transport protein TolQ
METAPAPAVHHTDIVAALLMNDWMGWFCVSVAGILSIISWTIIVHKFRAMRRLDRETLEFEDRFVASDGLGALFASTRHFDSSPLARLMRDAYVECELQRWFPVEPGTDRDASRARLQSVVECTMQRTIAHEQERMERGLVVLAVTTSLAPFIGLFGTVWGILGAFQAMGSAEGASLANLAPSLSTALVATIAGLFAAIPAVVAHSLLSARVLAVLSRMDAFANHLLVIFRNHDAVGSCEVSA